MVLVIETQIYENYGAHDWSAEVTHLVDIGLLESAGTHVRLTRRGKMLADSVGESFM